MVNEHSFFDINVFEFTKETIVDEIETSIAANGKKIFLGLNADCFNVSRKNSAYREVLQNPAYCVYPDGSAITFGLYFLARIKQERIVTTDLILYLLERIASKSRTHTITFLGGNEGIADAAMRRLNERFSTAAIRYAIEPVDISYHDIDEPFSAGVLELIRRLNENPTDILLVGLGCPKQEILCHKIIHLIPQKVLIPCGGLFSYYAGRHKRAPLWLQRMGLEWLFRLMLEPRRLWKRYLIGNVTFILRILKKKISSIY